MPRRDLGWDTGRLRLPPETLVGFGRPRPVMAEAQTPGRRMPIVTGHGCLAECSQYLEAAYEGMYTEHRDTGRV
ncbi:hypothetical protein NDU88_008398 [Pleurodeles waltl]|uniref:Uncharacterized protein n=1 Tax=Pleurodeles waltl TaxID=8319 RepID=A0AAV7PRT3_PLEWA|nr:hypothetical protein NDU88_008398 [Pleurodeles waltl]